jgi:phenylalanyl-tRNA synthetase beta chain
MLVSYEWLNEYVDLEGLTPEDVAHALTQSGVAVDVIYTRDTGIRNVVVGKVLSTEPHPQADRLKVCQVDVGKDGPLTIVCGAANVAAGQLVPVALEGASLPGGVTIKRTKLRGVESQGMICSAKELGFPEKVLSKQQREGIMVLPDEVEIGTDMRTVLGMHDQVLELDLTPNRSDCLSMIGVAYEVAAVLDREVRLPEPEALEPTGDEIRVDITVESEEDCPLYAAQVIDNLKVGPSPQWMQNRLISAGIRPVNNIVDITNYVMIEYGQPLHAFDLDKLSNGGRIVVRRARNGETIETLDGVTRACDEETLLITDGSKPIGIAGVMGGANSEVSEETTRVLLEAAFFSPPIIRRTSRKLGLRSEASNRFEKAVDPERIIPALQRAVELLTLYAGGRVVSRVTTERVGDIDELTVSLRHDRLTHVLGVKLKEKDVLDIFRRLRFPVEVKEGVYRVQVPTRRPDIAIEVDLIEEVARLYGYDNIPATLPWGQQSPGGLTREQILVRVIRNTLRTLGMHEVITYSLTSPGLGSEIASINQEGQPIRVAMPMSEERSVLRTSLLPHLIETAAYNLKRQQERVAIFEIGKTFHAHEKKLTDLPEERWELAGLLAGKSVPTNWRQPSPPSDFYTAKGVLETLLNRLGIHNVEYRAVQPVGFHPGRTAELVVDGRVIGILGQLHPQVAQQYDLGPTMVCQLDLSAIFAAAQTNVHFEPPSRHPAVTRDLALVVDRDLLVGKVEQEIKKAAGEWLESVTLFDVFTGEQIGEGKKSVAYSLVYRAKDRTLTDEEVNRVHQAVIDHLAATCGAQLRQ